jgi:hypothetical protein
MTALSKLRLGTAPRLVGGDQVVTWSPLGQSGGTEVERSRAQTRLVAEDFNDVTGDRQLVSEALRLVRAMLTDPWNGGDDADP